MIPDQVKKGAEKALTKKYGSPVQVRNFSSIGGGCINAAGKIETTEGAFFIKWNDADAFPGMFEAEAKGLKILGEAHAVNIPEVELVSKEGNKTFIITELIVAGKKSKNFWEHFGANLAKLHQHSKEQFGLDHDNYIGSLPQSNTFHDSWIDFFIEERLEKQIEIARNQGKISRSHISNFQRLYPWLNEIFPKEKPALIHGDLWGGNYLVGADGEAVIMDPAVYYGHREIELAFTKLFGGFERQFYISYEDDFPLEKGFEQRADIYNLYPLMVHMNLFGGGYLSSVENILRRF